MIRWIRGTLEASYVGEKSMLVGAMPATLGKSYQLRIYRAAVRDTEFIARPIDAHEPIVAAAPGPAAPASDTPASDTPASDTPASDTPASDTPASDTPASDTPASDTPAPAPEALAPSVLTLPPSILSSLFRQARIDEAHVAHARGPASYFLGPLFDVRVVAVQLSHPVEREGRAYGRMTGTVVGCVVLPEEAEPELVLPARLVTEPASKAESLAPGELRVHSSFAPSVADAAPFAESPAEALPEITQARPARPPSAPATRSPFALSSFTLAALVGIALGVRCGFAPCLLWALFMLPTLLARRLFRGVLHSSPGLGVAGTVLVCVQVMCVADILSAWWSADCKELALLPLLGLIAVLFPSGLLPARLPVFCNAAGLAIVLFGWCTGPLPHCREQATPASVAKPALPRTNADGSWPRRPPGR